MKKNINIVIVSHKFLTQPDDDLVLFLNDEKCKNVLHIRHSFTDAADRRSWFTWYKDGETYKEYATKDYKWLPEPLIYLKETYFTFKWLWFSGIVWDVYIGMDGLCVGWGNISRFSKKVKKTIFWAIDFVPKNRFKQKIKNKIYHWINVKGYKKSDEMWDLCSRMKEARSKFLGVKETDYRVHRVVPYGVWGDNIRKYSYRDCDQKTLVFMGHLLKKQGVQLVIDAIPELIEKIPGFHFKIIGGGAYRDELLAHAQKLKVAQYCEFKGKIKDHSQVEEEIAKSSLAVAPYIKKYDTWTYYTDPGKVKVYLACGVPVLLTDIPWNAREIEDNKAGAVIKEDKVVLSEQIVKLMTDENLNQKYRENAIKYAEQFNYKNIFKGLNL
ncbi:MAG: glycosyltransferase family 4 protein [PVC group bacterium]|nr:glycosyltransferase family 4 protein [PVC group bacterium]